MSDDSKNLSRVEDILSGEDYIPIKPMSRIEKLLLEGGGPGGKLPEVTSDDNGKILKVKDGAWDKGEDISGDKLPQVSSSDNGKVLKVVQGEWNIDKDEGDRLPVITPTDNDKILTAFGGQWIAKPDRVPSAQDCVEGSVLVARSNGWNGEQLPEVNAVPTPTRSDIGKVLKAVDEGEYDWNKVPNDMVKQTPTSNGIHDILLSSSAAGSAEATEGVKKSQTYPLKYDADTSKLSVGDGTSSNGGVDIGMAAVPKVLVSKKETGNSEAVNWIRLDLNDITFGANSSGTPDTWDGTNTSLKAAIAAAARAGGSEAVYLPLADYEALPTAEKEDPTKIYFVINEGTKVSPTLSADDGNFTVSSAQSGYDPWKVFDGSTRTDNNEYEYCYAPWGQHNGEWIAYSFETKQIFSKVHIRAAVMQARTLKYYIEGSNDGETWTNLISDADYVSVYHPALTSDNHYTWVNTDILLDTAKGKFSKIRFRQDLSIGYPYSGNRFNVANWDIYAAAASNKPSIYYKNVLYTPDELPATTISDAGKVLKVNEDGLWDKGDAPIPDINAVQIPPVIFDNGSLKKINEISGFPGLEKVFLTPTSYEALTQAEKEDLSKIYYVSLYEFFSSNDGTVVIRLNGDKTERLCFFNGFIDNFNSVTPYANFPEELRDVWTTYSNAPENVASTEYDENGDIRSGRYFGLRSASDWHVNDMDGGWNNYGPKNRANYAVIDMTSSTALQSNPWADPYNIPNGMTIYYGGKQYSEYEPAKPYVELTQAEYDALPSSKESDGIIYFING